MRTAGIFSTSAGILAAAGALMLAGCFTTSQPQQFRTFLLPPRPNTVAVEEPMPEPPRLASESAASLYANALPLAIALPDIPRPSETDFLLKKANDSLAAGKAA